MPEIIGALLKGRYRLDCELGQGGMGTVYCAHDTLLKRDVAVKVLSRAGLGTQGRARLLREAQAVAQLNHPNVVSVYDAGEAELPGSVGTVPFIVMELVKGDSLHDCPPGSLDEILAVACQVCTALEHAHAHGIIHRDLKPENVLLLPDGPAKLVDFGLARTVASRLTAEGSVLGTVSYIAPEQAMGQEIDGRADLYTLGVMLYEWTTGRLPFEGDDPVALIGQHLHASVIPPREHNPEIPPVLDSLIVQLLSKEADDRPASAADVRQVLGELARGEVAAEVLPDRPRRPAFLEEAQERGERPILVARERELAQLDCFLEQALAGQGRVVFVTGGPGRGKTALLAGFARRAMEAHDGLLVANGNCNAYSGVGDPYLPFRDVFGQLTGDVEAGWAAGTVSRDHALRLWEALPLVVQALMDHGPQVVPALLPGPALLSRARTAAPAGVPWLEQLRERVERRPSGSEKVEQSHLFQQVTNLLRALAVVHPLLLILDDLQWVDASSAGLLFHLGRRLEGSHVLVAGAYRPEEVAPGRDGERHPLEPVQAEFRRLYGEVLVDLGREDRAESRGFVNELLDTESNGLGEGFRQALFAHTGGHALFTIELLRAMQERGDLVREESGRWVEGTALDWDTLPARVEAVIEERIARLEEDLREILTVASVEGQEFTVQVVGRVQEIGERKLLQTLSRRLERRYRLVREQGEEQIGKQRLSRYRFAHALFQQYLYNDLSPGECRLLHGEIGTVLEELYAGHREAIAVQLARHYGEAGDDVRALKYEILGADAALSAYANREAVAHYRRALELTPSEAERAYLLGGLGEALYRLGRFEDAQETFRGGIGLYQALEDLDGVAALYSRLARATWFAGDHAGALQLCEEGLEAVAGAAESREQAQLMHEAARAFFFALLPDRAEPLCQRALEMAQRLRAVDVEADALATWGILPSLAPENALKALERAAGLAAEAGFLHLAGRAHSNLGFQWCVRLGVVRAAHHHYIRSAELSRQAGDIAGEIISLGNVIWHDAVRGDLEQAAVSLLRMRRLAGELDDPGAASRSIAEAEAWMWRSRGDWATAARLGREHLPETRRLGDLWDEASTSLQLAADLLEGQFAARESNADELDEAERALTRYLEIREGMPGWLEDCLCHSLLGALLASKGLLEESLFHLTEAKSWARQRPATMFEAYALWAEGRLAMAQECWPEAQAAFEVMAGIYDELGSRWYWARGLMDWAEALAAGGEPAALRQGKGLLRRSEVAFEEMGADGYLELVDGRLRALSDRVDGGPLRADTKGTEP